GVRAFERGLTLVFCRATCSGAIGTLASKPRGDAFAPIQPQLDLHSRRGCTMPKIVTALAGAALVWPLFLAMPSVAQTPRGATPATPAPTGAGTPQQTGTPPAPGTLPQPGTQPPASTPSSSTSPPP